jgi:radical SAM superfamily enzyme YgiQ (UPF0313 family)
MTSTLMTTAVSPAKSETSPIRTGKFRITFIHCPNPYYADTQNYGAKFTPTWAYTLAAHLPEGRYDLELYDTRIQSIGDVREADLFLFSGINQDYASISHNHEELKRRYPSAVYIIGGPICWSFHTGGDVEKLEKFDHIFIGDGEEKITEIVENVEKGVSFPKIINNKERFKIADARPFYRPFLDATIERYYGGVVEVSRGCPFLCEFCDIRILPDNNRAHNKNPDLIISEIDYMYDKGVRQALLACDNFIGDLHWAETVVDKILEWQARTGKYMTFFPWLTINLHKYPVLMKKMRQAGFDILFIGVESFSASSLVETAKVQNTAQNMIEAIRTIQSYGFIVAAGLIFGFDSDDDDCFEVTLKGIVESGLISGDPSLLTALPGTPLYRRMKDSGRLRPVRYGLGGYKYQTNIRYLLPKESLIGGWRRFVKTYNSGKYQYTRLKVYLDGLTRGNFIPLRATGYGNPLKFFAMVFKNPAATKQFAQRAFWFAVNPMNIVWAVRGALLAISMRRSIPGVYNYFQFWGFAWSTTILKYARLKDTDFDIESVDENFDFSKLLPEDYTPSAADEDIPEAKIAAQRRFTTKQLRELVVQRARHATAQTALESTQRHLATVK